MAGAAPPGRAGHGVTPVLAVHPIGAKIGLWHKSVPYDDTLTLVLADDSSPSGVNRWHQVIAVPGTSMRASSSNTRIL